MEENADLILDLMDADLSALMLIMIVKTLVLEIMQDFLAFKALEEMQVVNASQELFLPLPHRQAQQVSALNIDAQDLDQALDFMLQSEAEAFLVAKQEELVFQAIEDILIVLILVLFALQLESQLAQEDAWEEEDAQVANAFVTKDSREKIVVKTSNYKTQIELE